MLENLSLDDCPLFPEIINQEFLDGLVNKKRKELQQMAKAVGVKANQTNENILAQLRSILTSQIPTNQTQEATSDELSQVETPKDPVKCHLQVQSRSDLQLLAKRHGIKTSRKTKDIINELLQHEGVRKEVLCLQAQEPGDISPTRDLISRNGQKCSPQANSPGNQKVKESPESKLPTPSSSRIKSETGPSPNKVSEDDFTQDNTLASSSCREFCLVQDDEDKMKWESPKEIKSHALMKAKTPGSERRKNQNNLDGKSPYLRDKALPAKTPQRSEIVSSELYQKMKQERKRRRDGEQESAKDFCNRIAGLCEDIIRVTTPMKDFRRETPSSFDRPTPGRHLNHHLQGSEAETCKDVKTPLKLSSRVNEIVRTGLGTPLRIKTPRKQTFLQSPARLPSRYNSNF
eukprot:764868-Hanusia_phi.AAC.3